MRIGVGAVLVVFVLAGFATTAGVVEAVWWWTAQANASPDNSSWVGERGLKP